VIRRNFAAADFQPVRGPPARPGQPAHWSRRMCCQVRSNSNQRRPVNGALEDGAGGCCCSPHEREMATHQQLRDRSGCPKVAVARRRGWRCFHQPGDVIDDNRRMGNRPEHQAEAATGTPARSPYHPKGCTEGQLQHQEPAVPASGRRGSRCRSPVKRSTFAKRLGCRSASSRCGSPQTGAGGRGDRWAGSENLWWWRCSHPPIRFVSALAGPGCPHSAPGCAQSHLGATKLRWASRRANPG